MRITSYLLYLAVLAAICAAFLAGRYIGEHDTESRFTAAQRVKSGMESAEKLTIAAAAATFLQEEQPKEAQRVLEQYARLQVVQVLE